MPFAILQSLLAAQGQMIALDPPFASQATIGGVVASNNCQRPDAIGSVRDGNAT